MSVDKVPKVFISYSQDDDDFKDAVLAFSNRLRSEGVDAILDQYEDSPVEGWPRWMENNMLEADYILAIASKGYYEKARMLVSTGSGKGTKWENLLMYQMLYEDDTLNEKIIPVILNASDSKFIPLPIQGSTRYNISIEKKYYNLYWRLHGVKPTEKPPIGTRRALPEKKRRSTTQTITEESASGESQFNNPYKKNIYFSGRDKFLEDIHTAFHTNGAIAITQAITGLGGVGKTQAASEYAYRYGSSYDYMWWVTAEREDNVVASYKKFGLRMGLLGEDQYDNDVIIEAVLDWMDTHSGWLFIYDNVEDPAMNASWCPRNPKGKILITSRKRPNNIGKPFELDIFSEAEATVFLRERTGISDSNAPILAERLGYLPLALEQAAAFIKRTGTSYAKYLALLDEHGLKVLEKIDGVIDYEKPVTVTWEISISSIKSAAARQLLYMCSYLASENIDPELFGEHAEHCPSPLKEALLNSLEAVELWAELAKYSLLQAQDSQGYSMHRLLQEVVREKLKSQDDLQWARCILGILRAAYDFEYGNIDSHNSFLQLSPHVEAFLGSCDSLLMDDEAQKTFAALYASVGIGNLYLADYAKALAWLEKASVICEKVLGKEHPTTGTIYNNIAGVYDSQGNFDEALKWYEKALAISEKVLGKEHPDTATIYNNIAGVYYHQDNSDKGLEWFEKALTIREKILGMEHPDTAATYNNIALVYLQENNLGKALEWFGKALEIKEKILGKEHPDTAATYSSIANVYSVQGNYGKALELLWKALAGLEKALGMEHPYTATTYSIIAMTYYQQGDIVEALPWFEKALSVFEKVLGAEHPDTKVVREAIEFLKQ